MTITSLSSSARSKAGADRDRVERTTAFSPPGVLTADTAIARQAMIPDRADKVWISERGGAGRRSPTRHSVPPRANSDTPSARRFERLASRDARGEPRPDHPALRQAAAPQAAGGRLVAGTGGCRRVTARPGSLPRARRGDGGGRVARGWRAWLGPRGPNGGGDAPG